MKKTQLIQLTHAILILFIVDIRGLRIRLDTSKFIMPKTQPRLVNLPPGLEKANNSIHRERFSSYVNWLLNTENQIKADNWTSSPEKLYPKTSMFRNYRSNDNESASRMNKKSKRNSKGRHDRHNKMRMHDQTDNDEKLMTMRHAEEIKQIPKTLPESENNIRDIIKSQRVNMSPYAQVERHKVSGGVLSYPLQVKRQASLFLEEKMKNTDSSKLYINTLILKPATSKRSVYERSDKSSRQNIPRKINEKSFNEYFPPESKKDKIDSKVILKDQRKFSSVISRSSILSTRDYRENQTRSLNTQGLISFPFSSLSSNSSSISPNLGITTTLSHFVPSNSSSSHSSISRILPTLLPLLSLSPMEKSRLSTSDISLADSLKMETPLDKKYFLLNNSAYKVTAHNTDNVDVSLSQASTMPSVRSRSKYDLASSGKREAIREGIGHDIEGKATHNDRYYLKNQVKYQARVSRMSEEIPLNNSIRSETTVAYQASKMNTTFPIQQELENPDNLDNGLPSSSLDRDFVLNETKDEYDEVENIEDLIARIMINISHHRRGGEQGAPLPFLDTAGSVRIPCYVIIFLLGVVGNSLVIVTMLQNRKMRTITNVFLLNL
ncbi:hypothetical protein SK128_026778, partial [Halocaridina rubra]